MKFDSLLRSAQTYSISYSQYDFLIYFYCFTRCNMRARLHSIIICCSLLSNFVESNGSRLCVRSTAGSLQSIITSEHEMIIAAFWFASDSASDGTHRKNNIHRRSTSLHAQKAFSSGFACVRPALMRQHNESKRHDTNLRSNGTLHVRAICLFE